MKTIKDLVHDIKCELKHADKHYTRAALSDDLKTKDVYKTFAKQDLENVNILHRLVVSEIDKYKSTGKEVPVAMQLIWDYEHEEMLECVENLKEKISRI